MAGHHSRSLKGCGDADYTVVRQAYKPDGGSSSQRCDSNTTVYQYKQSGFKIWWLLSYLLYILVNLVI